MMDIIVMHARGSDKYIFIVVIFVLNWGQQKAIKEMLTMALFTVS